MLFHDEPTDELDGVNRRTVWENLQQVRATEQATLFMAAHELEEAYISLIHRSDGGAV